MNTSGAFVGIRILSSKAHPDNVKNNAIAMMVISIRKTFSELVLNIILNSFCKISCHFYLFLSVSLVLL